MTPSAPAPGGPTTAPASREGTAPFVRPEPSEDRDGGARLVARGLSVGYEEPETVVSRDLDLELRAGELVCVLGPNGAGKSTLLRTLAGLQPPLAGTVEIDGRRLGEWPPRELARRLAVVLTDRAVGGMMRGEELVRLGRHPHTPWTGRFGDDDRRAVHRALEAVDALHLANRPLSEISDGERQKITIARALAQEAEILVLDEVTAFLDLPRRVEILRLLRRLAHGQDGRGRRGRGRRAIVLATHDLDLALRSADRLWLLSAEGELRSGLPESLVLDGSFEAVFAGEDVDFDRESGAFRMHRRRRGTVRLEAADDADPVVVEWTRRALDRIGLEIAAPATGDGKDDGTRDATVTVEAGPEWLVERDGEERRYTTLDGLVAALSARAGDVVVSSAASPARESQSSPR